MRNVSAPEIVADVVDGVCADIDKYETFSAMLVMMCEDSGRDPEKVELLKKRISKRRDALVKKYAWAIELKKYNYDCAEERAMSVDACGLGGLDSAADGHHCPESSESTAAVAAEMSYETEHTKTMTIDEDKATKAMTDGGSTAATAGGKAESHAKTATTDAGSATAAHEPRPEKGGTSLVKASDAGGAATGAGAIDADAALSKVIEAAGQGKAVSVSAVDDASLSAASTAQPLDSASAGCSDDDDFHAAYSDEESEEPEEQDSGKAAAAVEKKSFLLAAKGASEVAPAADCAKSIKAEAKAEKSLAASAAAEAEKREAVAPSGGATVTAVVTDEAPKPVTVNRKRCFVYGRPAKKLEYISEADESRLTFGAIVRFQYNFGKVDGKTVWDFVTGKVTREAVLTETIKTGAFKGVSLVRVAFKTADLPPGARLPDDAQKHVRDGTYIAKVRMIDICDVVQDAPADMPRRTKARIAGSIPNFRPLSRCLAPDSPIFPLAGLCLASIRRF